MFTADDLRNLIINSPALRAPSKKLYLHDLNRYLAAVGEAPVNWTRRNTQQFYQRLLDGGMKPQSANRVLASLAYAGKWYASEQGDPQLDFARIQQAANKAPAKKLALDEAQARALLDACQPARHGRNLRDFALLVVMLETGMRRMSVARMDWAKVGPTAQVPIKRSDDLYAVPLSATAQAALAAWRTWCSKHTSVKSGPVFRAISQAGELGEAGLSLPAIYHILKTRADAAGIKQVNPHALRHTFVSWRVAAGVPFHLIAVMTGHKIGGGMLDTYTDRTALVDQARATTPPWLAAYVASH